MLGSALAFCFQGLLGHRIGALPAAEADFRQAIEITPSARWAAKTYALVFLIDILLDRGRRDEAAAVLSASRMPDSAPLVLPFLMLQQSRGRLRIAGGEIDSGVADMHAAGGIRGRVLRRVPLAVAVFSRAGAGQGGRAHPSSRAGEEEEALVPFGAPRAWGIAAHRRSRAGRRAGHRLVA